MLDELEAACSQAEAAMRARNWEAMTQAINDQRRVKQGIINELHAASVKVESLPDVFRRLQAIFAFRGNQLRRLIAYRNDVSQRLQNARKWKDAARSANAGLGPVASIISRKQ
ncbi:MAG: hypothetical protein JO359_03025 [Candidatus Eremiobacteraeota bacterium]|nr:hypothetical protein [Candidatus Eremiobacteraeota bacterium]